MKEYLEHKYGYINIDDENLYFTKTGVWQEAYSLSEPKKVAVQMRTKILELITNVIPITFFIYTFVNLTNKFECIFASFAVLLLLLTYIFKKKQSLYVPIFTIPFHKIKSMESSEKNQLKFTFLDQENKEVYQIVKFKNKHFTSAKEKLQSVLHCNA